MSNPVCLIVDDEVTIRKFLRTIIEKEQIQCLEAETAVQALKIVQGFEGRLDVIVTDIKMPGEMDGIDLAYAIGNTYPAIAVILISGYADEKAAKKATKVFKLIQKPFVADTVVKAVKQTIAGPGPLENG